MFGFHFPVKREKKWVHVDPPHHVEVTKIEEEIPNYSSLLEVGFY